MFPDYPQIEQIRQRLWRGRVFGQAAVMVGAGFSRNAESVAPGSPPFPLWRELAESLYAGLYPPGPAPDPQWHANAWRAAANGGVLGLAYEYETAFGRQALEDVVARAIPDEQYRPGDLHRLLLSLPWSDVFTTNYDTLLERGRAGVHERNYHVVRTVGELPGSMKPRIVKLHGSFPAYRPLILTQEDYRNYPSRFAPFVNTVQQALMENTLVLLGFSGEDPNFLQWIGWVRDRLGEARPAVYLCGVLDLSASRRRTLETLNVVPIDLGQLFTREREPDIELRHRSATRWLLMTLLAGEPPSLLDWPIGSNPSSRYAGQEPPIPVGPQPLNTDPYPTHSVGLGSVAADTSHDEILGLLKAWRSKRERYPGWVILPQANRDHLWKHNTDPWLRVLHHHIPTLAPPEDLFMLFELVWRLDRAMVPLSPSDAALIHSVLTRYEPFSQGLPADTDLFHSGHFSVSRWDWGAVRRNWMELAFALVRKYRETGAKTYQDWMDRLQPVVNERPEWSARWHHEACQYHLFHGDVARVKSLLESWPDVGSEPFWAIRRAGVHAEIGSLGEAKRIAESALGEIRVRQASGPESVRLLSEESWAMALLSVVRQGIDSSSNDWDVTRGRWERLAEYRCRPFEEINSLRLRLQASPPRPTEMRQGSVDTFTGRRAYTYVISSTEFAHTEYRNAYALLRLAEETGVPPRCDDVDVYAEPLFRAIEWITPADSTWASAAVIRWGSHEEVARWFDKIRIARMAGAEFADWYNRTVITFEEAIATAASDREAERHARTQAELLSRLVFRLTPEQRDGLLTKLLALHDLPAVRQALHLHRPFATIVGRVLATMDTPALWRRLPELLALPIPGEDGFSVAVASWWLEPFEFLQSSNLRTLPRDLDRDGLRGAILHLLRLGRNLDPENPEIRRRALLRLSVLHRMRLLDDLDRGSFGHVLWDRVDPQTDLPADTQFYLFALLSLPEPEPGKAREKIRAHLKRTGFPRLTATGRIAPGEFGFISNLHVVEQFLSAWLYSTPPLDPDESAAQPDRTEWIDWSSEEAAALLHEVSRWWDDEKALLEPPSDNPLGSWRQKKAPDAFTGLVPLFRRVILPRLTENSAAATTTAFRLLSELDSAGISTLAALPESTRLRPMESESVAQTLRRGLASNTEDAVADASEAVYRWVVGHSLRNLPMPPSSLIAELVNRVVTRRQPGLDDVLHWLGNIVEDVPATLTQDLRQALCTALDFLYQETELPDENVRVGMNPAVLERDVYGLPERRRLGARLASLLSRMAAGELSAEIKQNECGALKDWQRRSEVDPLIEVRWAWERPHRNQDG